MRAKNLLFSAIILSSLVTTNLTVLAEELGTNNSVETTVSTQADDVTEQPTENVEKTESVTNPLTNGEELTHTHQADLSQFENPGIAAFSARSSSNAQQAFIDSIAASAQTLASANDLYASVMIAQAIVESGWGKSTLASAPNYNLFGIKGSYNGQSVTMPTSEFVNGQWITVNAAFRKYPSYAESLQDNVTVLKTTSFQSGVYYYSGAWKSNTSSYKDATAWLTGRYATAPNYGSTLNNIIETYNLTQYDTPNSSSSPMYRLYNKSTGQHLYTLNAGEKNYLSTVGWKYEGIAWQAPNSGQPVYRLYNPNNGDHHYTMAQSEINFLTPLGWRYEGLSFYSGGSKPIYRLFNPNETIGTHHYTLSSVERDSLTPLGWRYEGIGFYAN
ncbi:glycoside hydrolase family 73 protein [Enterococcus mundtii]|uniref:Mannosyl-glycoprotein endo-beta-N-acetylglucosamidase n=1 Tax=Enterococcus mundtii TaxID=53346 RepID=A0A2S7RRC5_ENTMU|nr:glycoside hydrolase family 73 protein [Enterococcus mundtii]MDA9461207.1 N-acetylmuramoyl-L-alanine amidase family 4 [Enterococcus mundtii 3F]PQF22178.1 mannosyl-glycoprotein endo-beta-N-acetylglucosamidase [Enterococcus mundtii]